MKTGRHRSDMRKGPWQCFARTKADILSKLVAPGRILDRLIADAQRIGPDTYVITGGSALFLRARAALDDFRPLADDVDGEAFH